MGGACFQFRGTSATCVFEHHIPARHRRLRYLARHTPAALPAGIEASPPRHLPGMEAFSLPSLHHPRSEFRLCSTPRSEFRLGLPPRSEVRLCFFAQKPTTGPAPKVCQRCRPRSIADRVFFHHSHAQPSILAWAQDCPYQSCAGNRIALALAAGLPPVNPAPLLPGKTLGKTSKEQSSSEFFLPGLLKVALLPGH